MSKSISTRESGIKMSCLRDIMRHFKANNKGKESLEFTSKLQPCESSRDSEDKPALSDCLIRK